MNTKFKIFSLQLAFILLFAIHICTAQTGIWTELIPTNSPPPRLAFGMSEIGDGKLIIFGGQDNNGDLDDTWIFDYNQNNWSQITSEPRPSKRVALRLARITENKVLLFGGWGTDYLNDTWIFDLNTSTWNEIKTKDKPTRRWGFGLAQLYNGIVVLVGGDTASNYLDNDTWIFNIQKNNWIKMPIEWFQGPQTCEGGMLAQLDTGKVLYFGGWQGRLTNWTNLFDYNEMKWSPIEINNKPPLMANAAMVNMRKNQVVLWGGDTDSWGHYDELWLFDLNDTTWKNISTNIKPDGRYEHCISKLGQDSILLFGGVNNLKDILHNDTWLLTMDSVDDVIENKLPASGDLKSLIISNTNKHFVLNESENFIDAKLYDIYGKVLKEKQNEIFNDFIDFDASDLSNGLYFLVIQGQQKTEIIKVLIDK